LYTIPIGFDLYRVYDVCMTSPVTHQSHKRPVPQIPLVTNWRLLPIWLLRGATPLVRLVSVSAYLLSLYFVFEKHGHQKTRVSMYVNVP